MTVLANLGKEFESLEKKIIVFKRLKMSSVFRFSFCATEPIWKDRKNKKNRKLNSVSNKVLGCCFHQPEMILQLYNH